MVSPRTERPRRKICACLEALAYLITRGVREHEAAGQQITRITVSGGIARSVLMCEILATLLDRPLERLQSNEGPALGAAVTALAAHESHLRRQRGIAEPFTVADAVAILVKFREPVRPNPAWRGLRTGNARVRTTIANHLAPPVPFSREHLRARAGCHRRWDPARARRCSRLNG